MSRATVRPLAEFAVEELVRLLGAIEADLRSRSVDDLLAARGRLSRQLEINRAESVLIAAALDLKRERGDESR